MFPYCWDVHRANVLEGGDPAFPQLTASPHSMDSMLPSGEGNYGLQGHRGLPVRSRFGQRTLSPSSWCPQPACKKGGSRG